MNESLGLLWAKPPPVFGFVRLSRRLLGSSEVPDSALLIWLLDPHWVQCSVSGGSTFPEAVISKDPPASISSWETPAACLASPLDPHGTKAMNSSQRVGSSAVVIGKEKLIALAWIILYSFLLQCLLCCRHLGLCFIYKCITLWLPSHCCRVWEIA